MASRTPNYFRAGIDPSESAVREWIDRWAENSSDIAIRAFCIDCPPAEQLPAVISDPLLLSARRSRDSELHNYLKYVAARWLGTQGMDLTGKRAIRYEAQVHFPSPDSIELAETYGIAVPARSWKPRILTARDRYMNASHGRIIIVDVLGGEVSIEAGYTQPFNLLSPLLEELVDRAVWIPFPRGLDRSKFTVNTSSLEAVTAYEFIATGRKQRSK